MTENELRERMVSLIKHEMDVQGVKVVDLAERMEVKAAVVSRMLNSGKDKVSFWQFNKMINCLGKEIEINLK